MPVPEIEFVGTASELFPRPWAVVSWLAGDMPVDLDGTQQIELAETLGRFVRSLHAVDVTGVPVGPEHWGYRSGEPVTPTIDAWADEAANQLADLYDPGQVRAAWRHLRDVPPATMPPCWTHTDLAAENLLMGPDGRLVGVIDFGGLSVGVAGGPAVRLEHVPAPAGEVLRSAAEVDDATWARARAWAFVGPGLLTIANYRDTLPGRTRQLMVMVEAVASEVGVNLR